MTEYLNHSSSIYSSSTPHFLSLILLSLLAFRYIRDTLAALEKKYLRRFPNIKQIHTVSCSNGKNIDKLRSDIEKLITDVCHSLSLRMSI